MEKKIVYGFRKSRLSKGLCGAVLGAALLIAAGSVQAEEKVSSAADQSALSEAALSPTEASQTTAAPAQSEPVNQDKLPLEVSHADLDQAVAEAEKAGVQLKQEPTVDLGTARDPEEAASKRETALTDYATQVKEIRETTAAYQEQLKTYEKELSQKESANQALKNQYDKALASYEQESSRIQAENAQVQAEYEQKRTAYQAELSRIVKINQEKEGSYQAALAAYQEERSRILQENAQAKTAYQTAMESYATELKATRRRMQKQSFAMKKSLLRSQLITKLPKLKMQPLQNEIRQLKRPIRKQSNGMKLRFPDWLRLRQKKKLFIKLPWLTMRKNWLGF